MLQNYVGRPQTSPQDSFAVCELYFFGALSVVPTSTFKISWARSPAFTPSMLVSTTTPAFCAGAIVKAVLVPCWPPLWPTDEMPPSLPLPQPRPYSSFEPSEGFRGVHIRSRVARLISLSLRMATSNRAISSAEDNHPPP